MESRVDRGLKDEVVTPTDMLTELESTMYDMGYFDSQFGLTGNNKFVAKRLAIRKELIKMLERCGDE